MNAPLGPVTAADIDAYCARIGYDGPLTPTLATLKALQALHPATIVFENMDVLLVKTVDLAPAALADKLLVRGRGGYCFEQNTLFRHVLAGIGFAVESLMARVWWAVPEGTAYARTHMALRVTIDWFALCAAQDVPPQRPAWVMPAVYGGSATSASADACPRHR